MATRRYMLNKGAQYTSVTESVGAATAVKNIELTVDLAVKPSKLDVLKAIEQFKGYITSGKWPPA